MNKRNLKIELESELALNGISENFEIEELSGSKFIIITETENKEIFKSSLECIYDNVFIKIYAFGLFIKFENK